MTVTKATMPTLSSERLQKYREQTYRSSTGLQLSSAHQAVEFVNQRGFVFFWPIKDILLPSVWVAAAGDRPVPNEHDDPGHITWGWKDEMLDKRVWYYARLLRRRNMMVALDVVPYFYALSPNYGSPEEDYLIEYEEGHMPLETRLVYEAIIKEGALDTITLRKAARQTGQNGGGPFFRALEQLQVDMRIIPVAISQAGAWNYSFVYDAVHRYHPWLIEAARPISEYEARRVLVEKYFQSVGAARAVEVQRVFNQWRREDLSAALVKLEQAGRLVSNVELPNQRDTVIAVTELI